VHRIIKIKMGDQLCHGVWNIFIENTRSIQASTLKFVVNTKSYRLKEK